MVANKSFLPETTLVLHNPVSGRKEVQRRAAAVVQYLKSHGYHVIQTRASSGYLRAHVHEELEDWASLICIGGDGTLFQAIAEIPPSISIGFYPAGTINLLAHSLSIPTSIDLWVQLLQTGTTRDVYFGLANGRPFVSVGSVGFDARVVAQVSSKLKHWFHEGAYGIQAIGEFLPYRIPTYEVTVDGRKIRENLVGVIIGKGPYFAGPSPMFHEANHREPKLSVALLSGERKRDLLRYAYGLVRGNLRELDGVKIYSSEKIVVEASFPSDVELDGESYGFTPMTFTVESRSRSVLAP